MNAPTHCPPPGVCLPVDYVEARDGDTQVYHVRHTKQNVAVRLIDCWCPERHGGSSLSRQVGKEAKEFADMRLKAADIGDLKVWIPFAEIAADANFNIFKMLSFDRILGYVFIGPVQTLNRMMVDARLASTTKGGELGR